MIEHIPKGTVFTLYSTEKPDDEVRRMRKGNTKYIHNIMYGQLQMCLLLCQGKIKAFYSLLSSSFISHVH